MTKNTTFPRRPPKLLSVLKPFPFATERKGTQGAPARDGDGRGDTLTLTSSSDWDWPSTPGYEVSAKDAERRRQLQYLIAKLRSGENVKIKEIRSAITTVEWEQYEAAVHQSKLLVVPRRIYSMFKEYNARLRKADNFARKASDGASRPSRSVKGRHLGPIRVRSFSDQAESHYDDALELLRDLIQTDPGIVVYLDRPYRFGENEDTATLEPEGVPRTIWSRSPYSLRNGKPKQSKRKLQFSTLLESRGRLDELCLTHHRKGAGIGTAPVIPGIEDQWIIVDGEGRVV